MRKIIIENGLFFSQAAIITDGRLSDIYVEDQQEQSIVGNIYKGKVTNVLPGMQSIFVDVGIKKDVFVYAGDFQKLPDHLIEEYGMDSRNPAPLIDIKKLFRVGSQIVVQIMKDPISTKGARGTTHITLPGHFLVLMPQDNHMGISRRIENDKERQRLRKTLGECNKDGYGMIVRTAAASRSDDEIRQEYAYLLHQWHGICRKMEKKGMRTLIHKEPGLSLKLIRDYYDNTIDEIAVNNQGAFQEIQEFIGYIDPETKVKLTLFDEETSGKTLMEEYGLDQEFNGLLKKRIDLPRGGHLVLEHTEALTAIDVNSGSFVGRSNLEETVFAVNRDAAAEIVRQIKLRDIGGIIIMDFIDMKEKKHQDEIMRMLNDAFYNDKSRVSIKGITDFGLVEMTRKKIRNSLKDILTEECPACNGLGRQQSVRRVIDRIYFYIRSHKAVVEKGKLVVSSRVYDYINTNKLLKVLNAETGQKLTLGKEPEFGLDEFELF